MIRAHRVNATAQDDASLIAGWNVAPNLPYTLRLLPGASSCGVLLFDEDNALVASGAALVGTEQPCVLSPQTGQTVDMVDAELGWHLLVTTTGTETQREIRVNPSVDLPDEIHPAYADDDMALARATAAIDESAHYRDDVTATCPLGLGAGLGDVASVPVDGVAVVGQVESITWTAAPDGTTEQAVIRRHVAIAPEAYVEPVPITPPVVADDAGDTDAVTAISGNVLTNDESGLTVVAVNGLSASVGVAVDGSNGGSFTITADGAWAFDPDGDFALLTGAETADTSVTYYASDGAAEAMGTLTVTVTAPVVVSLIPADFIAHYKFDSIASGIMDETGTFPLSITGSLTTAAGKVGDSVTFPGTTGNFASMPVGFNVTSLYLCGWVYPTNISTQRPVCAQWASNPTLSWILDIYGGNFRMIAYNGSTTPIVSRPAILNAWNFVEAWVVGGQQGLCVDRGVPVSQSFSGVLRNPAIPFYFGRKGDSTTLLFSGMLDSFRFYTYVPNEDQRNALYAEGGV